MNFHAIIVRLKSAVMSNGTGQHAVTEFKKQTKICRKRKRFFTLSERSTKQFLLQQRRKISSRCEIEKKNYRPRVRRKEYYGFV